MRSLLRALLAFAALIFAQPVLAQTLQVGGTNQAPIGVRVTGVIDINGNPNPAVVPTVILASPAGVPYSAGGGGGGSTSMTATAADPTYIEGSTTNALSSDLQGYLRVDPKSTMAAGAPIAGATAQLTGCSVSTAAPSYTTATQNFFSCNTTGAQRVFLSDGSAGVMSIVATNAAITGSATSNALKVLAINTCFDGTTNQRAGGACPSSDAAAGITPVVTAAVASALVLKASAGNLYSVDITTGASAGYLMVFNATTAPADGAVTPTVCMPVAANTGLSRTYPVPAVFTTGVTAVFSTTGCFTKTASATAFITGQAK